jgi:hypothetical protein
MSIKFEIIEVEKYEGNYKVRVIEGWSVNDVMIEYFECINYNELIKYYNIEVVGVGKWKIFGEEFLYIIRIL